MDADRALEAVERLEHTEDMVEDLPN